MEPFVYDARPGRVVFAAGASRTQLADELGRLGAQRVLLICSPRDAALAADLAQPFADRVAGTCTAVRAHVPLALAEQARVQAQALGADALLALGGGSAIGLAKAVALTSMLPIIAVPTTYAGSEMTPIYGITAGQDKTTGRSLAVLPRVVVYDPVLTLSLPAQIAAPSAMNALAHCVEALYAPAANPLTTLLAEAGIRALASGAPQVVANPADLAARSTTLYGAYLAGAALASAGTSLHHKLCHILGGAYDLPHAELHSVLLPHVVAFLAPALPEPMARIVRALSGQFSAGLRLADLTPRPPLQRGEGEESQLTASTAIIALAAALGVPRSLRDIGLHADQLASAADRVFANLNAAFPRQPTRDDVHALLTAAMSR